MISAALSILESDEQRHELSEFYEQHKKRLYAIAFSKLHNRESAEDAVQEAFLRIADKPERFFAVPAKNRQAYADVIVRNIAIDMFEQKNKIHTEQLEENVPEDDITGLDDSLFDKISRDEILGFIDALPELQRNVLMLHCFFGLSIDETAEKSNISLAAAKKRLLLARKAVREFIERGVKNE